MRYNLKATPITVFEYEDDCRSSNCPEMAGSRSVVLKAWGIRTRSKLLLWCSAVSKWRYQSLDVTISVQFFNNFINLFNALYNVNICQTFWVHSYSHVWVSHQAMTTKMTGNIQQSDLRGGEAAGASNSIIARTFSSGNRPELSIQHTVTIFAAVWLLVTVWPPNTSTLSCVLCAGVLPSPTLEQKRGLDFLVLVLKMLRNSK